VDVISDASAAVLWERASGVKIAKTPAVNGGLVSHIVEFRMEGGGAIAVEVDDAVSGGVVRSARPGEVVAQAGESLEQALDRAMSAAQALIERLRKASPDEMEVQFGLKLSGELGAVLAKTGAEGNFSVTLTWKRSE
jgi:hypothetical protein